MYAAERRNMGFIIGLIVIGLLYVGGAAAFSRDAGLRPKNAAGIMAVCVVVSIVGMYGIALSSAHSTLSSGETLSRPVCDQKILGAKHTDTDTCASYKSEEVSAAQYIRDELTVPALIGPWLLYFIALWLLRHYYREHKKPHRLGGNDERHRRNTRN